MAHAVYAQGIEPVLVSWYPRWDAPIVIVTCPACRRRIERRALNWSADDKRLRAMFRCYPSAMKDPPCYQTFRIDMTLPERENPCDNGDSTPHSHRDEQVDATVTASGGGNIPSMPLPPGRYEVERTRVLLDDEGNPIGVEYLVQGRWLKNRSLEAVLIAKGIL